MRDQRIRDPIHNLIKFSANKAEDQVLWSLIQKPAFQRLRRIKQLGLSEIVYPGAAHTRLSHSLGTMQMARRMLEVLERNDEIGNADDHELWRCATLCAALLHDIGHGPLSHVFEELSRKVGIDIDHEDWTRIIVESEEISAELANYHDDLPAHVSSFFKKESGYSPYTSIVNSQLDADRLDFLIRDRYFTGIQFVAIDLDWLFDCLTIKQVPIEIGSEAQEYVFVTSPKGASVLTAYAHAYAEMYTRVYFHKTTRASQYMVQDILNKVFGSPEYLSLMPEHDSLANYLRKKPDPDLAAYLKLDDLALWQSIRFVAQSEFGESSILANRLLNRDLYKCFEPPIPSSGPPPKGRINEYIQTLRAHGLYLHLDRTPPKGLKQFDVEGEASFKNIFVWDETVQEPRPLSFMSPPVAHMAGLSPIRFYFATESERDKAREIWRHES